MGLFGLFGKRTKADWDNEIMRLNVELARGQSNLSMLRSTNKNGRNDSSILNCKSHVEGIKAAIANAKIQRRNAPN